MELNGKQYKLIVENSPNMIWRAGIDAKCDYFNHTWLNFTGRTTEQELADGWTEGVHPDDFSFCLQIYLDAFAQRAKFEMEYRLKRFDGIYRWINDRGVPVFDEHHNFIGYIGSCVDITEKKEGEMLKDLAQKDLLCQVYNRNYLDLISLYHFEKAISKVGKLAFIMVDIDSFKSVNDCYGHLAGDRVLRQVASFIKSAVRDNDICGRYGGEEFVVVAIDSDLDCAVQIAERIRQSVFEGSIFINEDETEAIPITVSCGVSVIRESDTLEEMLGRMDQSLYMAKHAGKNCVRYV